MRSPTTCLTTALSGSRPELAPTSWSSRSRTPARRSRPRWSPRLPSHFFAATNASASTTQASASGWQSSSASPKHTRAPSPLLLEPPAGSASRCESPPRRRLDDLNQAGTPAAREPGRSCRPTHIVGISKLAYVLATSRCLQLRHDLQHVSASGPRHRLAGLLTLLGRPD